MTLRALRHQEPRRPEALHAALALLDVVLRQQGDFRTDYEDVVIIVPRNHLDDLILALQLLKP